MQRFGSIVIPIFNANSLLFCLQGHTGSVYAVVVASKNKRVYSGSMDGTIRVWATHDGTHLQTLEGHTGGVLSLALGHDDVLFSGSADATVCSALLLPSLPSPRLATRSCTQGSQELHPGVPGVENFDLWM